MSDIFQDYKMKQRIFSLEDNQELTMVDEEVFKSVEEQFDHNLLAGENEFEALSENLDALEVIHNRGQEILAKESISTEDVVNYKAYVDLALSRFNLSSDKVYPSLENYTDPRLAIEAVYEKSDTIWTSIKKTLKNIFLHTIDNIRYTVDILDFQKSKIAKLRNEIHKQPNEKVSIVIPNSVYTRYGDPVRPIESSEELLKHLKSTLTIVKTALEETERYTSHSFMTSIKTALTVFSEERYLKEFEVLYTYLENMGKKSKMFIREESGITFYTSGNMLGMGALDIYIPERKTIDFDDFKSCRFKSFTMHANFIRTSNTFSKSGDITLEDVDKVYALEILKAIDEVNEEYRKFNSIFMKIADFANNYFNTIQEIPAVGLVMFLVANTRILMVATHCIKSITTGGFYFAKGHTKHGISIVEKINKKLDRL